MNKFDAKVGDILQEFVGGLLKGAGEGIAAFNKTLTDPTAITQYWKSGPKSSKDSKGKENPYVYSSKNPPNIGDIVVWTKNPQYKAKVVQKLDSSGNYGIVPVGPNNIPANYVFLQTVNDPNKWIVANKTDVNLNNMTYKSAAIIKENNNVRICPKQNFNNKMVGLDYIMVGNTKTDMDNWINEKYYSQPTPQPTPTAAPANPSTPRTPRSPRRP